MNKSSTTVIVLGIIGSANLLASVLSTDDFSGWYAACYAVCLAGMAASASLMKE